MSTQPRIGFVGFGEAGYGRLPYRYVEEHLACDFWTIWKPEWAASGEFEQTVLRS